MTRLSLALFVWLMLPSLTRAASPAPGDGPAESPATPAVAPQPAENANLDRLEQECRTDAAEALARLELVRARKDLQAERLEQAAARAQHVLTLLRQVSAARDVSVYELQAEGILARVARRGVHVEDLPAAQDASEPTATSWNDAPPPARGAQRLAWQARLRQQNLDAEGDALVDADDALHVPREFVTYPSDWAEIAARRAPYAGGLVARGPSWWDEQRREWYVGLYDIDDLTREPADFLPPLVHPAFGTQALLDREALRQSSDIFRGDAADLAAGIPLLRYFGGYHATDLRPRDSRAERDRIISLIHAFTESPPEGPLVVPVEP